MEDKELCQVMEVMVSWVRINSDCVDSQSMKPGWRYNPETEEASI